MNEEMIDLKSRIRKEMFYSLPVAMSLTGFSTISTELQLTGRVALTVDLQSFITLEEQG